MTGFNSWAGAEDFYLLQTLGLTQSPIQWVLYFPSDGIKRTLSLPSVTVKKKWSYTSELPYCLLGVHRYNITFGFLFFLYLACIVPLYVTATPPYKNSRIYFTSNVRRYINTFAGNFMGVNVKLFSLRTKFCGQGHQVCYKLCHVK